MSSEETPNSFSTLKLLKVDVRTDHNGVNVVMEFIDDNGTTFKTPSIPYPENFDPMRIENVDCVGDEIRIKNGDGVILFKIYADSIDFQSPIETFVSSNSQLEITPDEDEGEVTRLQFNADWGSAMTQAFSRANQASQHLDNAIYRELSGVEQVNNERPTVGASAWFREQATTFPYPNTQAHGIEDHPKIEFDYDMKCTCCEGKIHYPDKLIKLLGEEGTIKYFKFCKKTNTEPQMFCCSCFGLMSNNSNIISAVNKMNNKIKDMMDLTEREETVTKREKELDKQLKAIPKKKGWFKK